MKALITGASSGIGKNMAYVLANKGIDLILVARSKDEMVKIKENVKVNVDIIEMDLLKEKNVFKLYDMCKDKNIDILINNAGFGLFGIFTETDLERELEMIDLNIKAYHILTENSLQYTADSIAQICNYANLAANIGEPEKAITALKKCVEYTEENSGIYAELLWNTGIIYLQMNDKANAVPHLKRALNIYAEIYEDEPELTQRKISELQDAVSAYGINAQNLISEN